MTTDAAIVSPKGVTAVVTGITALAATATVNGVNATAASNAALATASWVVVQVKLVPGPYMFDDVMYTSDGPVFQHVVPGLADVAVVADAFSLQPGKALADDAVMTDSYVMVRGPVINDSAVLADAATFVSTPAGISDTATALDVVAKAISPAAVADGIAASDAMAVSAIYRASDIAVMTDSVQFLFATLTEMNGSAMNSKAMN